eukprot:GHVT01075482.1.p1 GENE.GHVT01075482.1~~GHVT01075482.1.p1  ORF type:complete len:231 (+),score=13.97 GHVT01075482.1:681-1373(+)
MRIFCVSDLHVDYVENLTWLSSLSDVEYRADIVLVAGDVSHDSSRLLDALQQLKRKFRLVFFTPGNHDVWLDHQTRKLLKEKIESSNSRPISDELLDSYGKLKYILKECNKQGILTAPTLVCGSEVSSSGSVSSSACQNTKDSGVLDTVQSSPSSPLCSLSNCSPDDPQRTSDDYCTSTSDKVWIVPILSWHHPEFDTEPKIAHVGGQEVPPPEKLIQDFSRFSTSHLRD